MRKDDKNDAEENGGTFGTRFGNFLGFFPCLR
jgi:hypothetical protein